MRPVSIEVCQKEAVQIYLINQEDGTIRGLAKLILGVYKKQAMLQCHFLSH
jgi:hypothetical protein